jgi:hypothetical protein
MKTLCNAIRLLALGAGTAAVLPLTGFAQAKQGGVTIENQSITIHPGTKLSKADETALNNVLSKYDKKLYRVETYKDGKLVKTVGELKLDKETASEVTNAKGPKAQVQRDLGLTDSTIIIAGSTKQVPTRSVTTDEKAKALINQLKPILQKYSKP